MQNRKLRRRRPDMPRRIAYRVLRAVADNGAYANLELAKALSGNDLVPRDAAFVTELVAGSSRLAGTYDRILMAASGRSVFDPALIDALRLGVHQLLSMRVPVHAAVGATVDLAAAEVGEKVAGLTNAVLRKVAARDLEGWVAELSRHEDALGALALRTHHPRWIAAAYRDVLGEDAEDALAANNEAPITTLAIRPGLATRSELGGEPTEFSPWGTRRSGNPGDLEAVAQGRAGVQDEGSQLMVAALTTPVAPQGPWLDLCAGPGGKAALLAGLAIETGTRVLAAERQPHRAALVASAVRGYSGSLAPVVIAADGTQPPWRPGSFARVLADVPCTGLGALRRRPEARWRRVAADLEGLVLVQRALLATAIDSAAPGGIVAYVTCSPHRDETTGVVSSVLAGRDDIDVLDAPATLPGLSGAAVGPYLQLWPHRHGTDAMFCALLRVR